MVIDSLLFNIALACNYFPDEDPAISAFAFLVLCPANQIEVNGFVFSFCPDTRNVLGFL